MNPCQRTATALLLLVLVAGRIGAFPGGVETPEFVVSDDLLVPEEITKNDEKIAQLLVEEIELALPEHFDLKIVAPEAAEEEVPAEARVSYAGSQLWRVVAESNDKKRVLGKLRDNRDISSWGGNQTAFDILVSAGSKGVVQKTLNDYGINFDIVMHDVQKAIDEENPLEEVDEELENRQARWISEYFMALTSPATKQQISWKTVKNGHKMSWQNYHRIDTIHSYLHYLEQTYPNLCTVQTIGSSVQGNALKVLKISDGKPGNKAVWVDGGMHAREWISPASTTYIINQLVLNWDSEPQELRNLDWYFLPVANPDGYEYSHITDRFWRKNRARSGRCAGTDLNRNFGYKWGGKGSGRNPCQEIYAGSGPFSEPETAAIRTFIKSTRANWKAYVSFHSYGQYILYPWGYDRVVTPDYLDLHRVAQEAASTIKNLYDQSYTIGSAGISLYPASGGSDDWAKGSAGMKYAYTIELRDSGAYGFLLPAKQIVPTAREAWAALKVIATAASKE